MRRFQTLITLFLCTFMGTAAAQSSLLDDHYFYALTCDQLATVEKMSPTAFREKLRVQFEEWFSCMSYKGKPSPAFLIANRGMVADGFGELEFKARAESPERAAALKLEYAEVLRFLADRSAANMTRETVAQSGRSVQELERIATFFASLPPSRESNQRRKAQQRAMSQLWETKQGNVNGPVVAVSCADFSGSTRWSSRTGQPRRPESFVVVHHLSVAARLEPLFAHCYEDKNGARFIPMDDFENLMASLLRDKLMPENKLSELRNRFLNTSNELVGMFNELANREMAAREEEKAARRFAALPENEKAAIVAEQEARQDQARQNNCDILGTAARRFEDRGETTKFAAALAQGRAQGCWR